MPEVFSDLIPAEWAKTLTDEELVAVITGESNLLPKKDPKIKKIFEQATYDKSLFSWQTAVQAVFTEAAQRFCRNFSFIWQASMIINGALEVLGEPLTEEQIERLANSSSDEADMRAINKAIEILKSYRSS